MKLILLSFVVLTLTTAYTALKDFDFYDYTNQKIREATGLDIRFNHIVLKDYFYLEFSEIEWRNSNSEIPITIKSIELSLTNSILYIINSKLQLDNIYLSDLNAELVREMSGKWNIVLPKSNNKPNIPPSGLYKIFNNISCENCNIQITDSLSHISISAFFPSIFIQTMKNDSVKVALEKILINHPSVCIEDIVHQKTDNRLQAKKGKKDKSLYDVLFATEINISNLKVTNMLDKIVNYPKLSKLVSTQLSDIDLELSNLKIKKDESIQLKLNKLWWDMDKIHNFLVIADHVSISKDINISRLFTRSDYHVAKIDYLDINENGGILLEPQYAAINLDRLEHLIGNTEIYRNFDFSPQDVLTVKGRVSYNNRQLNMPNVRLIINNVMDFEGFMSIDNLNDHTTRTVDATIKNLYLNLPEIVKRGNKSLKIPNSLVKLSEVNLQGSAKGPMTNMHFLGDLNTGIGSASADINTNFIQHTYKGEILWSDFQLGKLINEPNLGKISGFFKLIKAKGFTIEGLEAQMVAGLDSIFYRGKLYKDIDFQGLVRSKVFNGNLFSKNKGLDLGFDGYIDLQHDKQFRMKCNADIKEIDLQQLGIVDTNHIVALSGKLDISGTNLNNMIGEGDIQKFIVIRNRDTLDLRDFHFISNKTSKGMHFGFVNKNVDFDIEGIYDLVEMPKILKQTAKRHFEPILKYFQTTIDSQSINKNLDFHYDLKIKNIDQVLNFLKIKDIALSPTRVTGEFAGKSNYSALNFISEGVQIGNINLQNIDFDWEGHGKTNWFTSKIAKIESGVLSTFNHSATAEMNNNDFLLKIDNHFASDTFDLDIVGEFISGKKLRLSFPYEKIFFDNKYWKIANNGQVTISKNYIDAIGLYITDGKRKVRINDIEHRGIEINNENLDFAAFNKLLNYPKLYFEGNAQVYIQIKEIFTNPDLIFQMRIPNLSINQEPYGALISEVSWKKGDERLKFDLDIRRGDTMNVDINGNYHLANKYLKSDVSISQFPLSIFEYIINGGISNTSGTVSTKAQVYGDIKDLKARGDGLINQGKTTIDFLGLTIALNNQTIQIKENWIDLNGVQIIDPLGNIAYLNGGIKHELFKNFDIQASLSSDRAMVLNTTLDDNPVYYGVGIGKVKVDFSGSFEKTDITVNGTALSGTDIKFLVNSKSSISSKSFIHFRDRSKDSIKAFSEIIKESGVNFKMNLNLNREAKMSIIYDQLTNEVLEGYTEGYVRLYAGRDGQFTVYGDVSTIQGKYLYTAYGVVAKTFSILPGGSIKWTGDPINAQLKVAARYSGLKASIYPFIQEFLTTEAVEVKNEAKRNSDIDLILLLDDYLYRPSISFDIQIPELTGTIKNIAENKLRSLKSRENGINNQVVGLLFFKSFLPEDNPFTQLSGDQIAGGAANTIYEFISTNLSIYFSNFLKKIIPENSILKDIEFEFVANEYGISQLSKDPENINANINNDLAPDAYIFNSRFIIYDDWVLSIGGNYSKNFLDQATYNFNSDYSIEKSLTRDKKIRVKLYRRGDIYQDVSNPSKKTKYGAGIFFRKEFGKTE